MGICLNLTKTMTESISTEDHQQQRIPIRASLYRFLHLNPENKDDRNAFYLVIEMFWATFLAAASSFNSAYAIRLGASDREIGYLSSIPALLAILISIPAGKKLQKSARKKQLVVSSLTIYRIGFLAIGLVPWFNVFGISNGTMVVGTLIVFSSAAMFFNVGFSPIQAEVITENRRAAVISMRMQIYHAVYSLVVFLLGLWLEAILFPLNYQIMYMVTFGMSILSIVFLLKLEMPEGKPYHAPEMTEKNAFRQQITDSIRIFNQYPVFLRFMLNTLFMNLGLWAVMPLFTLYYVNDLKATDGWLGLQGALHSVTNIGGYALWRKIVYRFGENRMLKITTMFRPLFPLLIATFPNLTAIMIINSIWGVLIPGLGLSHSSVFLKTLPPDAREEATAIYSTIQNIGAFLLPLLGIAVSEQLGIRTTLFIFAGVRFLGSLTWTLFPIEGKQTLATPARE